MHKVAKTTALLLCRALSYKAIATMVIAGIRASWRGARRLRRFTVRQLLLIRKTRGPQRFRSNSHFGLPDPPKPQDCNPGGPRLSEPQHSRTETRFLFSRTPHLRGRAVARRAAGRRIHCRLCVVVSFLLVLTPTLARSAEPAFGPLYQD